MSNNQFNPLVWALVSKLPIKRSVFISYHHALDQMYYDSFSNMFSDLYNCIKDNSLERALDSDDCEYVMRRIRENHISGSSCTIVLCGIETPFRKYVDWEIKATLDKQHGLVGVLLPTNYWGGLNIPERLRVNVQSGYAILINWSDLNKGPIYLKSIVEMAINKSKNLIENNIPMRRRNGP